MASIVQTASGNWKAVVRRKNWPTKAKTFRTKKDCVDWARRTEDEIVRGLYIDRTPAERMTVSEALERYEAEITPTKKASTQISDLQRSKRLIKAFGQYSLAAITSTLVASYRDKRLKSGKSNNTVRLELALLSHLFTTAIQEWGIGLTINPVLNVKKTQSG